MNEAEKKAVRMLSEEEREKIVGGATENDALSSEQCNNLRDAVNGFDENRKLQFIENIPKATPETQISPYREMICYGGPRVRQPIIPELPKNNET